MILDNTYDKFLIAERVNEFKDKAILPVSLKGKDIILVRVNGNYYPAENHCPSNPLDRLDEHKGIFNQTIPPDPSPTTYPVEIQGNNILVKI